MGQRIIEVCSDDREALIARIDEMVAAGARILSLIWQPAEADCAAGDPVDPEMGEGGGCFLIIAQADALGARLETARRDLVM